MFYFLIALFSISGFTQELKWYDKIKLKGYAHLRYNRLAESNKDLSCSQCDKSWGDKKGFFLRRARLVFYGDVSSRVFIYLQPDYATDTTNPDGTKNQNYFNIRDAYFDYSLTKDKVWRTRTGISKVLYGQENLQSSSHRVALDRSDALNSGAPNERDLGLNLMFTPIWAQENLKALTKNHLKGAGDYGLISFGIYNGQSLNREELNNDLHRAFRATLPFKLSNGQFIETGISAYEGKFFIDQDYYEARAAMNFIYYPQPFGFRIEYTEGNGPEFDIDENKITNQNLKGGYAQLEYQIENGETRYFPYVRYQFYDGGKKLEGGKSYQVNEVETGLEFQPDPACEFTLAYAQSDRTTSELDNVNQHQNGSLVRVQAQFNY